MQPKDSPIWNLLIEDYPELPQPIREQVYTLLAKSKIPVTDKIFPWVMETTILRVQLGHARLELKAAKQEFQVLPQEMAKQIGAQIKQAMGEPMETFGMLCAVSEELLVQLKRAAIIEANLAMSGWRGIGAAIGAIFRVQGLAIVVGVIALCSVGVGGVLVWRMTEGEREIIEYNREVIERCHRDYAADEDLNGWYTCPKFQVPMPQKSSSETK